MLVSNISTMIIYLNSDRKLIELLLLNTNYIQGLIVFYNFSRYQILKFKLLSNLICNEFIN